MKRVQRKRTKGYRLPENCVYVGRPSRWGNPYFGQDGNRNRLVELYEKTLGVLPPLYLHALLEPLKGKDLACWCPLDQLCHADVLIEFCRKAGLAGISHKEQFDDLLDYCKCPSCDHDPRSANHVRDCLSAKCKCCTEF